MKKNTMKLLCVVLCAVMLMGMLTVGVTAATTNQGIIDPTGGTPGNWAPNNPAPSRPQDDAHGFVDDEDGIDIIVRKKWVGDDVSKRPKEVLLQLIENGDPVGDPVVLSSNKSEAKNWKYTWTNMDKNSEYTIVEINTPEGYTSVVEHGRANYWTVTNTYHAAPSTGSAPAVKDNPKTGASAATDLGVAVLFCCAAAIVFSKKK